MSQHQLTVALVYDLKSDYASYGLSKEELSEFDEEVAIFAVESALHCLGHTVVRVGNLFSLVQALVSGAHKTWDLVFNVAEGLHGTSREAQVPGLLEAYQIPFTFSDARVLSITHDKALTKSVLRQHGIPTAAYTTIPRREEFSALNSQDWLKRLNESDIMPNHSESDNFPVLFIKPNQEGSSKGVSDFSRVSTAEEANKTVRNLRGAFQDQDILVEEYLTGREFTVSLIGTGDCAKVLGIIELVWYPGTSAFLSLENKEAVTNALTERLVSVEDEPEVAEAARIALAAWRVMSCRDAGRIDVRSMGWGADAKPQIVEINALAGLRPNYSFLAITADLVGCKYAELIKAIVESAWSRAHRSQGIQA